MSPFRPLNSARRSEPVDLWTGEGPVPQGPQAQQQQNKRTFDVLQSADIFTRYGQVERLRVPAQRVADEFRWLCRIGA